MKYLAPELTLVGTTAGVVRGSVQGVIDDSKDVAAELESEW
jgi:hypothetical protein